MSLGSDIVLVPEGSEKGESKKDIAVSLDRGGQKDCSFV